MFGYVDSEGGSFVWVCRFQWRIICLCVLIPREDHNRLFGLFVRCLNSKGGHLYCLVILGVDYKFGLLVYSV